MSAEGGNKLHCPGPVAGARCSIAGGTSRPVMSSAPRYSPSHTVFFSGVVQGEGLGCVLNARIITGPSSNWNLSTQI